MHDSSHPLLDSGLLQGVHRHDCPGCQAYAQALDRLTEAVSALTQQVGFDHLTRVTSRFALEEAVVRELQRLQRFGHPVSLVICDIDNFKFVNEAYGHSTGDAVLKALADVLRRHCRTTDIVGRWGGDEFAVLMPNTSESSAVAVADKLRHAIRTADLPCSLPLTASLGVAGADADERWETWVNRADHAMFEAKRSGRNRVVASASDRPGAPRHGAKDALLHLTWRPAYASGHPLLDRQHEALFDVANAVLTVAVGGDLSRASALFGGLVNECRSHFAEEESVLARARDPGLEAHARSHRRLLASAEQMQSRLGRGEATATELFEFIARDLIAGHILKEDQAALARPLEAR
jgi:diguanylate cyclase (GGDEF)-like protein/hemerythrin-like metal-binding protein